MLVVTVVYCRKIHPVAAVGGCGVGTDVLDRPHAAPPRIPLHHPLRRALLAVAGAAADTPRCLVGRIGPGRIVRKE